MLREALDTEFTTQEDADKFQMELIRHIAGEEKTIVQKIGNIKHFIDFCNAKSEQLTEHRKEIDAVNSAIKNKVKSLKEYVLFVLKQIEKTTGQKGIEADGIKITYQGQGPKEPLNIPDPEKVPFELCDFSVVFSALTFEQAKEIFAIHKHGSVKMTHEPNQDKVLSSIKAGNIDTGGVILPQAEGIRIKGGEI
jgi:hypothetical protein